MNPQTPSSRHYRRGSLDEYGAPSMVAPPQVAPKPPPRSRNPSRASLPPPMTPSQHVPFPSSPNMQNTAAAASFSTHEDPTVAPYRTRSRAGSTVDPVLKPSTGSTRELYRHGSGSQASLISNKTTASMRMRFDPSTYVDPAYNVNIESELDLSARATSPSRKAVSTQIGDAKTSIWKKKAKK